MTEKTAEERLAALEAELASLRKPVPREAPLHRTIEGQGPTQFDRTGNRVLPDPLPASTTVGGGSFGVYRTDPDDGTRRWCPDGVERDPRTGEVTRASFVPTPGPGRSSQHQQSINILDRMFPVAPRPIPDQE